MGMNILGTGLSGLVGSRVVELLSDTWSFEDCSLDKGVDITQFSQIETRIVASAAPWVFHFAAMTDVDRAEEEKNDTSGIFWKVNVTATENIVEICKKTNKRVLYISTDYVFDGTSDEYTEESIPNPQGWYAKTKFEGEKRVATLGDHGLIVRIANPYRAKTIGKVDFVHKIVEKLKNGQFVQAPSDQIFVPTFIDDIAYALETLVRKNASGVYHVVGSQALTPYQAARSIAVHFALDATRVQKISYNEYYQNRAPRPFRAMLKNDKITHCGVTMHSFDKGLEIIHQQVS